MLPYVVTRPPWVMAKLPCWLPFHFNKRRHICVILSIAKTRNLHYNDVIMDMIASQITSLMIVFSTVYLDTDQRKHQNSASLAFVHGIHRRPVNSPHKWPVTPKMFPFDDVIMIMFIISSCHNSLNANPIAMLSHWFPDSKVYGAHMGPTGPRWAPCWPHEPCYLGCHFKWCDVQMHFRG